jgi:hypothetical protein
MLGVMWFSGRTSVGVVRVIDEYEGIKYYIAAVSGLDEQVDTQFIMDWGSTFPKDAGDKLFGVEG